MIDVTGGTRVFIAHVKTHLWTTHLMLTEDKMVDG